MLGKKKNKNEESEELQIPKLTRAHFLEITELFKKYGGREGLLMYWGAIRRNDQGHLVICDYSEQSLYAEAKYEKFEPLKGIFYTGHGFYTTMPYNWCSEWLRQWEWWAEQNQNLPEIAPLFSMKKTNAQIRGQALSTVGARK